MIKKLFKRVFGKKSKVRSHGSATVIPFDVHKVGREGVTHSARRVTDGLQAAGFKAFVVGGAVRDLLLGRQPKDFDVATDATPEEVRRVFRRSRIIGRRFRLVHVMFGEETVETSTFRRMIEAEDAQTDEHGRLLRDNEFGDQEQDAARRDFTANALFYDPTTQEIFDYHNGYEDIRANTLRMIGDPEVRYREDPVRMLRAVRLSAKLGMKLDEATAAPIAKMKGLLANVPEARMFDEMLKLLLSGHSLECVTKLRAMDLHHGMLPMLDVILEQPMGEKFVTLALRNTDQRIQDDKSTNPAFLFACLLWHEVLAAWNAKQESGEKPIGALHEAMDEVLERQRAQLGQRPLRLLGVPRFRAAYDFLLLRCESGELAPELGKWWGEFQGASEDRRAEMLMPDTEPKKKRRRKKKVDVSAVQAELPIN